MRFTKEQKRYLIRGILIRVPIYALIVFGLWYSYHYFSSDDFVPPDWYPQVEITVNQPDLVQPGVTVFGPNTTGKNNTAYQSAYFAYDQDGEIVWHYPDEYNEIESNCDLEVMPDGNYLIHINNGWRVITPKGKLLLEVTADDLGVENIHHDVTFTPQGTFIAIANITKEMSVNWSGRAGEVLVKGEMLIEVDWNGDEVWCWDAFDHLDVNRVALEQVKTGRSFDWLHANGLQYFEEDNSIILSLRSQSWVIKIDHETGQIVWRLGRDGDFELVNWNLAEKRVWFSAQHAPELHTDGSILIYDNGNERSWTDEDFSRAVIYQLDEEKMTVLQTWQYQTDYFTDFVGDVDLLENGNVLVTAGGQRDHQGPAQIIEVTQDSPAEVVWKMEIPDYDIFRATRISMD